MTERDYAKLSDPELIQYSRSGDDAATDFLMEKYMGLVRRQAKSLYLPGGDEDDLLQEGMVGLFKAVRDYNPDSDASFYSFASLCIQRQIYTALETSGRKKHLPLNNAISLSSPSGTMPDDGADSAPSIGDTLPGNQAGPEDEIIGKENSIQIMQRIREELSTMELQVLSLQLAGMPYTEIASELKKTPKQIDNAQQRIRNKIRQILKEMQ